MLASGQSPPPAACFFLQHRPRRQIRNLRSPLAALLSLMCRAIQPGFPPPPSLSLSLASSREHAKTRADEEMRTREVFRPGHGHTLGTVNRIEETSQKRAALRTSECHTFWSMAGRSIFGVGLDQHNNQHIGPHLRVYRDIQSSGGSF